MWPTSFPSLKQKKATAALSKYSAQAQQSIAKLAIDAT